MDASVGNLHLVAVAFDSERETTLNFGIFRVGVRVFQGAAREYCFLG